MDSHVTEYESIRKDVLREAKLIMENNMTNPTNLKEAWIEALKSGKYHHGQKRLKIVGEQFANGESLTTHCCLGVLVEVLGDEIVGKPAGELALDESYPEMIDNCTGNRIKTKDGNVHSYNYFEEIIDLADERLLADLYTLNDEYGVNDYTRQIKWIEDNVVAVEQKE